MSLVTARSMMNTNGGTREFAFIGTEEYEKFKKERFGGDDTKVANSEAFRLVDTIQRDLFKREFEKTRALYYRGQPPFEDILRRIAYHLEKL